MLSGMSSKHIYWANIYKPATSFHIDLQISSLIHKTQSDLELLNKSKVPKEK